MVARTLSMRLKALREQHGLTKTAVAKQAKMTVAYLSMLESRDKVNPTLATLQRLAKALKVTVAKLVE